MIQFRQVRISLNASDAQLKVKCGNCVGNQTCVFSNCFKQLVWARIKCIQVEQFKCVFFCILCKWINWKLTRLLFVNVRLWKRLKWCIIRFENYIRNNDRRWRENSNERKRRASTERFSRCGALLISRSGSSGIELFLSSLLFLPPSIKLASSK